MLPIALIRQVPEGQAGKLTLAEKENPLTVRKWLVLAAKAMDLPLGIRRRGRDIYFWVESPLSQEHTTGAQQRRSTQPQPFVVSDEDEEVVNEQLEGEKAE